MCLKYFVFLVVILSPSTRKCNTLCKTDRQTEIWSFVSIARREEVKEFPCAELH